MCITFRNQTFKLILTIFCKLAVFKYFDYTYYLKDFVYVRKGRYVMCSVLWK